MKNTLLLVSFVMMMASSLWADDMTRAIQQRLKDKGFYYGEVNGRGGEETSTAIRRYQIRYGLRVTGQLNDETLRSLGMSGGNLAPPAPGYQENGGSYNRQPQGQYQQQPPYQQPPPQQFPRDDYRQPVPQRPGPEDFDEAQPAPYSVPPVAATYPRLFAGTLYERSPSQIQENVLFAVQGELRREGYFRGIIDGRPSPATADAILRFQREQGLPMTGRLDNETLGALRAFPGQRNGPPEEFSRPLPPGERIYRGVPVQN